MRRFDLQRWRGWIWAGAALAVLAAVAVAVRAGTVSPAAARGAVAHDHWLAGWGASPQAATGNAQALRGFHDRTLRELVFTSVGGSRVRVRFTNAFGARPLRIGAATVGVAAPGAALSPGTRRALTFAGARSVTIPPGAETLSDPVVLTVAPRARLAISVFLPGPTGPLTQHAQAREVNAIATGDHAGDVSGRAFTARTGSWYAIDGVDVDSPPRDAGAVVALGDSITDGVGSPIGAEARWPNDLARRLDARPGETLSVVDEGIGGNRVLNDAPCCGVNAVARFERDVAARPGARDVILLEGINDIGYSASSGALSAPHTAVSARQIEAGDEQLIALAHAAGLRIFGATLTPFAGARYWSRTAEAKRDAVNRWIRTGHAFDGVIDFARAVQDPRDPDRLAPADDSGDHLHPNAAGYRAMAAAVDLRARLR